MLILLFVFSLFNPVAAGEVKDRGKTAMNDEQLELFLDAIRYRHIDRLEEILSTGVNPNVRVHNPMASTGESSLLVKLIDTRYPNNSDLTDEAKVIELLLKAGSNLDVRNDKGLGLLHLAAKNARLELVDILIKQGVDKSSVDIYGQTAIFYAEDVKTLSYFLEREIGNLSDRDKWGLNLLHEAVNGHYSRLELVRYLSTRIDVNSEDDKGNSPIWTLLKNSNLALDIEKQAITLIEQGADISSYGISGHNLLIKAIRNELEPEFVQHLLSTLNNANQADKSGYVAAHHATEFSQGSEYLKILSNFGADFNRASLSEGNTALMFAIIDNNRQAIDFLLTQKIDLNITDKLGKTALNYALEKGDKLLVENLKQNGAVGSDDETIERATEAHKIEQARPKSLADALKAKNTLLVKQFYRDEKAASTLDIMSSAFIAAKYGFTDALIFFVSQGFDLNSKRQSDSFSLLHYSVMNNQIVTSQYLIDHGLDVNDITPDGRSVFSMLANSSIEMLTLLEKSGARYQSKFDSEIVSQALMKENYSLASIFSKRGYPFNKAHYFNAEFVVLNVIRGQDPELLNFLLSQGYDINSRFYDFFVDCNLLYAAINFQADSMIQPLLDAGIDVEALAGSESMVAAAIKAGSLNALQMILNHKPSLSLDNIDTSSGMESRNALIYALYHRRESVAKYLLDFNIDVNQVDDSGRTALHYAAEHGFKEVIESLIAKGAVANVYDNSNDSPLNRALFYMQEDSALTLLALVRFKEGDINRQTKDGATLLHLAAEKDLAKVVDALIRQGADVNILNAEMLTAADVAFINDHKELAEELEILGDDSKSEYEVLMNIVDED